MRFEASPSKVDIIGGVIFSVSAKSTNSTTSKFQCDSENLISLQIVTFQVPLTRRSTGGSTEKTRGLPCSANPLLLLEAASGFEPLDKGFADPLCKVSMCFRLYPHALLTPHLN